MFEGRKEVTTCDGCGGRMTIPPGRIYRGQRLHKGEAVDRERRDMTVEKKVPLMDDVERRLENILDVGSGT